ncbi:helix-turn-helix transcriptional regulator [Enterococcus sp. LJL99]
MKIERLLAIIILLLSRSTVTANVMANRFGVSKRTIYRDITTLENAGFPIVAIYGNEGGFQLMNEFKLQSYTFSEREKNWLLQALELQTELFMTDSIAQTVKEKLRLLIINETSLQLNVAEGTLHHESIEQATKDKLYQLQQLMATKNKIQIDYISGNGQQTKRKISPMQLILKNGSWYLKAYCDLRQNERAFKLTRIRKIEALNDKIIDTCLEKVSIEKKKMAHSKQTIICQFAADQLGKLVDFFTEDQIKFISEGKIEVIFEEECSKNLLPFLLMFGAKVTVIKPIELKKAHITAIQTMNKLYLD